VPSSAFCQNKTFGLVGSPIGGTWSSTNTAVVTVTNQGVAYTAGIGTGEVIYTVSNTNGCSRSYNTVGNVVACTPRGVNANQTIEQSFTIFPNPAKSLTSLMIDKLTGEGKIIVTDLYGKQVKTQAITIGKNSIDVSKLSKGMYFVSVITTEEKITKKLIVE